MSIVVEQPSACLIKHNNDDLHIANAARVSFDKHKTTLDSSDKKGSDKCLINYLARSKLIHFTPFTHVRYTLLRYLTINEYLKWSEQTQDKGFYRVIIHNDGNLITFLEKGSYYSYVQMGYAYKSKVELSNEAFGVEKEIPNVIWDFTYCNSVNELRDELKQHIYTFKEISHLDKFVHKTMRITGCIPIARQLFKHKVDFTENEISRRYVSTIPTVYIPEEFRGKPINGAKQGSHGVANISKDKIVQHLESSINLYNSLLVEGLAPEQARIFLPQAMNTSWYWTASLNGFKRVVMYRTESDTQTDTQILGNAINDIIKEFI